MRGRGEVNGLLVVLDSQGGVEAFVYARVAREARASPTVQQRLGQRAWEAHRVDDHDDGQPVGACSNTDSANWHGNAPDLHVDRR